MPHAPEHMLLALVEDTLAAEEREQLEVHLEECDQCRRRLSGVRRTWEELGAWDVTAADRDLTERVLERARSERRSPAVATRSWMRAAAIWVVCGALGVLAGRTALRLAAPAGLPGMTASQAGEALQLGDFQNGSPALFSETIVGFDDPRRIRESETHK